MKNFPRPMLNVAPESEAVDHTSNILARLQGPRKFYKGVPSFIAKTESASPTIADDIADGKNETTTIASGNWKNFVTGSK